MSTGPERRGPERPGPDYPAEWDQEPGSEYPPPCVWRKPDERACVSCAERRVKPCP